MKFRSLINTGPEFTPKLITLLRQGISRHQVFRDITSGVIVGIVALPLAIAFAIASGVPPNKGLVTAIVAGLIISTLGGSRVQIGGPTGAFVVIVFAIVQEFGIEGLTIATIMAGFLIIGLGLAKLGNYLRFVPYPLIIGFTSGIAVIIFSSQLRDLFGLPIESLPADFIQKWSLYVHYIDRINWISLAVGIFTIVLVLLFPRISKKIPGSIVAIVLTTVAVFWFNLPVETIESKFGALPTSFDRPSIPMVNLEKIQQLIQPAIAIALLGSIESLLSAVVADGMIGGRHRSNMELIAQGTANIFSGLFGGIPATGAIARTATNIRNGGRTPIAGIVHALILLFIMLLFSPLVKHIPLACLAGILIVVAWHMGEWHHFLSVLKTNKMEVMVLLVTFILTIFFDLILAIEVGMILSSFVFMKRMSETTSIENRQLFNEPDDKDQLFEEELANLPKEILLYEINGPLFFGASQKFQEVILDLHHQPKVLILRMRHVPFIDVTGLNRLKEICVQLQSNGTDVIISGANESVRNEMKRYHLFSILEERNVFDNIRESVERAQALISELK
ncbi:MAG: SulP family inorganic anion transporter [Saprospiraceae bacterium]|nr:SulP family inorganic anion transporter [Saprospiraceae bacterium]